MRSQEFIIEDDEEFERDVNVIQQAYNMTGVDVQFALSVRNKCRTYLEEVNFRPCSEYGLYRGLQNANADYVSKKIRTQDRNPKDSTKQLHTLLNKFYTENFGANFRDAMFCTGSYELAQEFGQAYTIFPVGDFKYLWDMDSKDIYVEFLNYARKSNIKAEGPEYTTQIAEAFIEDVISKHTFDSTDLMTAIKRGHEIMIRGKSYLACRVSNTIEKGIEEICKL